ncbi:hypothetical protein ACP4OV_014005 [Aristida adscensionis]
MASAKKRMLKMVKAFYRRYIRKHHTFILCKHEKKGATRLDKFLKESRLIRFVSVHGIKKRWDYTGMSRPTEEAMAVIRALVHLYDQVHKAGLCFNGNLSLKNLYWITGSKEVKISGLTKGDIMNKNLRKA